MGKIEASFFQEEIRCDFLVDQKRKKVWATELLMLERLDEVCRKHDITYWAFYGTLLGAVRHQGFIPWDDDIDLVMFRDDYERFQAIGPKEFREPYFFQCPYTDRRIWPISKIRDSRTTGIQFQGLRDMHQGIFIDIFPLDSVPDEINHQFSETFEIEKLLWKMVKDPVRTLMELKQELMDGKRTVQAIQCFLDISKEDVRNKFRIFEDFCAGHFGETDNLNHIMYEIFQADYKSVRKEWFRETIFLPFENTCIPAPIDYDKILTQCYGDYHQMIQGGGLHQNIILDPDIPWDEYFSKYL